MANRHARTALEEAMRYTQRRKTMGQTLIEHQAIRTKIAKMTMAVESSHQMVEHMTYQMIHMDEEEQRIMLAGMSALLKVQTCQTFEMCTREASQCMGGISYVRSGQGRKLVRLPCHPLCFSIVARACLSLIVCFARGVFRKLCCAQSELL
jgi:alkylation response protein AidB-like acyl-CoA dehydrogenase